MVYFLNQGLDLEQEEWHEWVGVFQFCLLLGLFTWTSFFMVRLPRTLKTGAEAQSCLAIQLGRGEAGKEGERIDTLGFTFVPNMVSGSVC